MIMTDTQDTHEAIEMLLPWYVNGTLDVEGIRQVDQHLDGCAACHALLAEERQLKMAIAALPVAPPQFTMPPMVERRRPAPARRSWPATRRTLARWRRQPGRVAGLVVAQAAMLGVVFVLAQPAARPDTAFRMLSSTVPGGRANAIIIFQPETPEADFRRLLVSARASIVGGPTASRSYLLSIADDERAAALSRLRNQPQVILVQPLDGE